MTAGTPRHPGAAWVVFASVGVVALAIAGVFVVKGTAAFEFGHVRAAVTRSQPDARASQLTADLQDQLRVVSWSPGHITGSLHTEGDFVALTQSLGGAVLSFRNEDTGQPGGTVHVADVMLGLRPVTTAATGPIQGDGAPACFEYTFRDYPAVQQRSISCPAFGYVPGQETALQLTAALPQGQDQAAASYPLTVTGGREFLTATRAFPHLPELLSATGDGVFAAAIPYEHACFFLRISAPSAAPQGEAAALWLAPMDDQGRTCDGQDALAASVLYGVNGASEG